MEKKWSLSIAVKGLFVSAFLSTIFGVANASAYTVTFNSTFGEFDGGATTNIVEYDDDHTVKSGEYKTPINNTVDEHDNFIAWYSEYEAENRVDLSQLSTDTTVYAAYEKVILLRQDYTGQEETFTSPINRYLQYELWGAQGGPSSATQFRGLGGYSRGFVKAPLIYINIGGQGVKGLYHAYNGGGMPSTANGGSGGGATHIATTSGELASLASDKESVKIVASGGGGAGQSNLIDMIVGSGGGFEGANGHLSFLDNYSGNVYYGLGGSQTAGGLNYKFTNVYENRPAGFGIGGNGEGPNQSTNFSGGGGGSGYYGGSGSGWATTNGNSRLGVAGGGSGFIGNSYDGVMYGYNVPTSDEPSALTYSTTNYSPDALSEYAKEGNGYVRANLIRVNARFIWSDDDGNHDITYEMYPNEITPPATNKAGYAADWKIEGNTDDDIYDFDVPITHDLTFVPVWKAISYSLIYNLDGGALSEVNPASYTIETDDITLINPTKDYYDFIGWSGTGLTGNTNLTVIIPKGSIGDRDYTANYTPIPYTITYNLDGGTNGANNPTEYNYESNEIVLARPTKEGYTFTGWSGTGIDSEDDLDVTIPVQSHSNREYTAHWNINQYTATFNANSGATANPETITKNYNVALGTLPTTSRTGYDFDGWYTEQTGGTEISDTTTMPAEDHTYYAHWTIQTFNITYDLNGGELAQGASNPDTYTYESADINLAKPSRTGYTFLGWSGTGLTDNIEDVTIAHNSLGDRSYKAEFQINEYTATFDANAGETANPETITKNYDEELGNLPETSRLGYKFLGWFTDATAGDEITGATKMPAGNVIYYAHWEIITYTIEYDLGGEDMDTPPANDASNPTSYTVEDADITLKAATPGDTWHYFVGWALDRDTEDGLTDDFIIDTSEVKNIKVYAIFQANPYTVTIDPVNGEAETTRTVRGDQEIGELPTPTKDGYDFLGWFYGNKQVDEHFHPRSDARIVAQWEEIPMVPNTGVNSASNTGEAIVSHIVTFAACIFALFIVVALRKHKTKNEA